MEHDHTTPGPEPEPVPAAPRRPRSRTVLLIAGAAALGVLAGTVTGYAIQYDRDPTPLPPLAQQKIDQPKPQAPNESTTVRSVNAQRWYKTDDDLTKLLVEAPAGAKVESSGYESPDAYAADYFVKPGQGLGFILRGGIRRIAGNEWSQDGRVYVTVHLFQYRDRSGAEHDQSDTASYMTDKDYAGNPGKDLPGVPAAFGHLWIDSEMKQEPGYVPTRSARVVARRGDVVMDIRYTTERSTVDEDAVVELAKRQWERL